MAKVYLRQILEGKMSIEDVPARWRGEVALLLLNTDLEGANPDE